MNAVTALPGIEPRSVAIRGRFVRLIGASPRAYRRVARGDGRRDGLMTVSRDRSR